MRTHDTRMYANVSFEINHDHNHTHEWNFGRSSRLFKSDDKHMLEQQVRSKTSGKRRKRRKRLKNNKRSRSLCCKRDAWQLAMQIRRRRHNDRYWLNKMGGADNAGNVDWNGLNWACQAVAAETAYQNFWVQLLSCTSSGGLAVDRNDL